MSQLRRSPVAHREAVFFGGAILGNNGAIASMLYAARPVISACAAIAFAAVARAEDPPRFWAVTGVAGNDVLHLRDVPSADSKSIARIPPNARGLKHLGCRRNQPPMEQWVRMSEAARRDALTLWCRVEFRGRQGWVAGRYLKRDGGPAR